MIPVDTPDGFSYGGAAIPRPNDLCTYSLQSMVYEICIRAGMDPRMVDVTALGGIQVRGFTITNLYAAYGAIQSLSSVFFFDPTNSDGAVRFIPRGANAIATITEDDMIVTSDDSLDTIEDNSQRSDSIQIPRVLHLNYYDVDGGSATDQQNSERAGDWRATGEQSLQTAVILSADEAKRVVGINHKVMVEDQKSQLQFTLSDKWLSLVTADTVFVQYQGKTRRGRIVEVDTDDGQQAYKLLQDRQSAYISNVQGYPADEQTPPPDRIVGLTTIEPIDIHIIDDHDDYFGCYIAVAGSVDAWIGAQVDVSLDGGATFIDSMTLTREATIGKIVGSMTDHPIDIPDQENSIIVQFALDGDELEQISQAGLLNKGNLAIIGNEVIQFKNVSQDTSGDWHLSYFLRGRKGTESVAHSTGERFILLDRNTLNFIPAQLIYRNRPVTLRATSLNGDATDVTTITFTYTGQSQVEYAPKYLQAHRVGTDLVASWQGIGKLGAGVSVAYGLYFVGFRVSITDGTNTSTVDLGNVLTTTFDVSGFSSPITLSVLQLNSLIGEGPATTLAII
jgi:hypothetical protein